MSSQSINWNICDKLVQMNSPDRGHCHAEAHWDGASPSAAGQWDGFQLEHKLCQEKTVDDSTRLDTEPPPGGSTDSCSETWDPTVQEDERHTSRCQKVKPQLTSRFCWKPPPECRASHWFVSSQEKSSSVTLGGFWLRALNRGSDVMLLVFSSSGTTGGAGGEEDILSGVSLMFISVKLPSDQLTSTWL
ncbi:unnamed protein product [Pleuronectes platessa]|uniref:Uncharacterized protein n=1 Tax=Pleuronectes platessa TaxID=8262 RepID=A0A9N7TH74_PLEPL|nr:unnamed protein product [Pleuronectes platessa]